MSTSLTLEQALQMAMAHHQAGQLAQAEALYRQILAVQPQQPDALHLLGVIASQVGQPIAAAELIEKAIALNPNDAAYHCNLGAAFNAAGRLDDAIACYQQAVTLHPNYAEAHHNLGIACFGKGLHVEAAASYQRALEVNPAYSDAAYNLGVVQMVQGKSEEAAASFQNAVNLKPNYGEAWNNLSTVHMNCGRLDDAIFCSRQAVALQPNSPYTHSNLGNALFHAGRIASAIECYREAVRLNPENPLMLSSLIYTLYFDSATTSREICAAQQEWNQRFAVPLRSAIGPHVNDPDPQKRLKIGYVSPDFYAHACGHFLLPLFEAHDHRQVEVYCYASVRQPDHVTDRMKQSTELWRDVRGMSDEAMAQLIREDGIDILVDLSLHMADNRLLVFARKPAPVQASWLGYPETSGLDAIEYRLTDAYLEPPGGQNSLSSEQALFLPDAFGCYDPFIEAEQAHINELPALTGQPLTFGNLNNFAKISDPMLMLWAQVLAQVPKSRLLLLASAGSHQQRLRDTLQAQGVAPERVEFLAKSPRPQPEYLALYHQIDLMLDTLPYSGHTTLCDALWMGVPVVTLAGKTAVGRGGVSILSNIGLPELIAQSEDEFVRIAVDLATDLPRLTELRATMRKRMLASPLMDGPQFARGIEAAYRQMWATWCQGSVSK